MTLCDGTRSSEKWCCGINTTCCASSPVTIPALFKNGMRASLSSVSLLASPTTDPTSVPSNQTKFPVPSMPSPLSQGAITGIVIGVVAAAVLAFVAGCIMARRRMKSLYARVALKLDRIFGGPRISLVDCKPFLV
jgi:hypothetical protein